MRTSTLSRLTLQKAFEGRARTNVWVPSFQHGVVYVAPQSLAHTEAILSCLLHFWGLRGDGGPTHPWTSSSANHSTLYRWEEKHLNSLETYFCDQFFAQHSLSHCVFFSRGKRKITLPIFNGRVIFKRSPRRTRLRSVRRRQAPWQARGAHRDLRFAPCPLALREAP